MRIPGILLEKNTHLALPAVCVIGTCNRKFIFVRISWENWISGHTGGQLLKHDTRGQSHVNEIEIWLQWLIGIAVIGEHIVVVSHDHAPLDLAKKLVCHMISTFSIQFLNREASIESFPYLFQQADVVYKLRSR